MTRFFILVLVFISRPSISAEAFKAQRAAPEIKASLKKECLKELQNLLETLEGKKATTLAERFSRMLKRSNSLQSTALVDGMKRMSARRRLAPHQQAVLDRDKERKENLRRRDPEGHRSAASLEQEIPPVSPTHEALLLQTAHLLINAADTESRSYLQVQRAVLSAFKIVWATPEPRWVTDEYQHFCGLAIRRTLKPRVLASNDISISLGVLCRKLSIATYSDLLSCIRSALAPS